MGMMPDAARDCGGRGAAGLVAAGPAGQAGAKVTLLEKNERLGKKMVITGKGRCNVTNDCDDAHPGRKRAGQRPFLYGAFTALDLPGLAELPGAAGVRLKVERGQRFSHPTAHSMSSTGSGVS